MADTYREKEEQLIRFLNGGAEPILQPERAKFIKRYIEKTKALSHSERKTLAEFIISHSE
jgi:cytochrome c551/c552